MPNVTGGRGGFGGSGTAGRDASNTGTGRSSSERAAQAGREAAGRFKSSTAPDGRSVFTSTGGLSQGISVSPTDKKMAENRERMSTYNSAAGKWNKSAKQRSFGNLVNAMSPMGFSMEAPDLNRPATFGGGDYHLGWNPGSLAGLASPFPGGGVILGAAGQALYSGLGGKNPVLTGPGDMGMQTWGDIPGAPSPTGPVTPGGGQFASTGNGGPQTQGPVQTPTPSIFAPQPKPPAPQGPSIFTKPPQTQSPFQVPGGNPYGFTLFGRPA